MSVSHDGTVCYAVVCPILVVWCMPSLSAAVLHCTCTALYCHLCIAPPSACTAAATALYIVQGKQPGGVDLKAAMLICYN
jgi:hypothetical protein